MITYQDGFMIVQSSMNKEIQQFEVIESGLDSFSVKVKEEMEYYGLDLESLSKITFIGKFRLGALINGNAEYEPKEMEILRRRLHFK